MENAGFNNRRRRDSMSLDISLNRVQLTEVFSANITHNLGKMEDELSIYDFLWRPEEVPVKEAVQLIAPLKYAIKEMKNRPEHYKKFDSRNGWGTYDNFLPWLENLLKACEEYPDAKVSACV